MVALLDLRRAAAEVLETLHTRTGNCCMNVSILASLLRGWNKVLDLPCFSCLTVCPA